MSSPAGPTKRLGPKFAVINDVDRQLEEELDLASVEPPKRVDDEIDELLSDNEEDMDVDVNTGKSGGGNLRKGQPEWVCRWDECWKDQEAQEALVEHVQTGMSSFTSGRCQRCIANLL